MEIKKIEDNEALRSDIRSKLRKENREKCNQLNKVVGDNLNKVDCSFYAFDGDKLVGGLVCDISYGWIYGRCLYVEPEYRDRGIATQLFKEMENYATHNGLVGVRLETWDFQAREFYEKIGYEVFAELVDYPIGITEYQLRKYLNRGVCNENS